MCLIAYVPSGKSLTRDVFDNADQVNPHGIGVMSSKGVQKFYGSKHLKNARNYVQTLVNEGIAHAVHWRYATHGSKGLPLCHPFKLPDADIWMMHNGVIGSTAKDATAEASDTLLYVNKLVDAPKEHTGDLTYWNKVCDEMGHINKGLIMYGDGHFIILNQDDGAMIDGIWYSNRYSLPVSARGTESHFVPARLRPASDHNSQTGGYRGWSGYGGHTSHHNPTDWGGPFGSMIYWSSQMNAYGFWMMGKFQKLTVEKGPLVEMADAVEMIKAKVIPPSTTITLTEVEKLSGRKCVRCLRYKENPPLGFLMCYCTDKAVDDYIAAEKAKGTLSSGPSLEDSAKVAAAVVERCEHGGDNWENCRECIAELENDWPNEVQKWLADRQGHNWRLRSKDPDVRANELASKVIYLPLTSEK